MLSHRLFYILSRRLVRDAYTLCDKAACAYFVAVICRIRATDRSDKILSLRQWFSHVTRGDLLQQLVAAI